LNLDYVDVPVMFSYHDKRHFTAGLGAVFGSLVRAKEARGTNIGAYPDFEFRRFSAEGMLNASFLFAEKFGVNLRFAYSFTDISKEKYGISNLRDSSMRNNLLTL